MACRISTEANGGQTVYTLHDDSSGASASILPSYGFNLFDLRLPAAGEVRRVIVARDDFAANPSHPGRNGTPILFPFPNRIRDGRFRFQDKDYQLPLEHPPHAIHGFAIDAAWDVEAQASDAQSASLTGRYQISKNTPQRLASWPSDAVLQVRYTLQGRRLSMEITVNNPTAMDLPYGFGIHPYFQLPMRRGGDPDQTRIVLPASRYWELSGSIPTGETQPVDQRLDFRAGRPRTGLKLDDVLTDLKFDGPWCICRLEDRALGAEIRISVDRHFRELVVFTPPVNDELIAVEPYTQTTDAINLRARGIDGGLRILGHGQQETMTIRIETVG